MTRTCRLMAFLRSNQPALTQPLNETFHHSVKALRLVDEQGVTGLLENLDLRVANASAHRISRLAHEFCSHAQYRPVDSTERRAPVPEPDGIRARQDRVRRRCRCGRRGARDPLQ